MFNKKIFKYILYVFLSIFTLWIIAYFLLDNIANNTIKSVPYSEIKPDYGTDSSPDSKQNHSNQAFPTRSNDTSTTNVSFNEPEAPSFHFLFKHNFLPKADQTKEDREHADEKEVEKNQITEEKESQKDNPKNSDDETAQNIPSEDNRVGKALRYTDLPSRDVPNARMRFTLFFNAFKNNDYITGVELAKYYNTDKNFNRLVKNTLCGFLENNISRVTRVGDRLYITTKETSGIHKRIKIPLVEDMKIDINNGSSLEIKPTIKSKAPLFDNAFLLPIDLNGIYVSHNGSPFPTTGYLSGNFFFTEYSKSRLGYQIK
jgi:hypothetical protein